ncbi:stress response protein [Perilla frutescens var. hirtella]|nr:stress response protein [Perilla frutescens var. hirtella]
MNKVTKSKKNTKAEHESNVAEQEKAPFKRKKMGSEIDEIFAAKKRKRSEKEKKGEDEKPAKVGAANVRPFDKKKGKSSKSRSFEEKSSAHRTSQSRKKTADGLTIFTEEELGVGKADAGGTALCPFDCNCCF